MTDERRTEIEQRAINTYGENSQVDKAVEEMSELTKALLKYRIGFATLDEIREEAGDVQIMLDQMRLLYGGTEDMENYKLNRLWARMETGNQSSVGKNGDGEMMEIENRDDLNKLDRLGKEALSDDKLMGLVLNGATLKSVKKDILRGIIRVLLTKVERLTVENEQNANYAEIYKDICDKHGKNFRTLLDKAKVLQTENTTLKKVLTELVQAGKYNVCELCGADCIDAGLDFVDEMSQCGCFKLRNDPPGRKG